MVKVNNVVNCGANDLSITDSASGNCLPIQKYYNSLISDLAFNLGVNFSDIPNLTVTLPTPGVYEMTAKVVEDVSTIVYSASANSSTYQLTDNFVQTSPITREWVKICCSSDGNKLAVAVNNGYIYTSIDSGSTWVERTSAGSKPWRDIACSTDGTKLVAVAYLDYIYTSNDSGASWQQHGYQGGVQPNHAWTGVASSGDGTKIVAITTQYAGDGYMYTSPDSGATWVQRTSAGFRSWNNVASSRSGAILIATVTFGNLYVSVDGGDNWVENTSFGGTVFWQRGISILSDVNKIFLTTSTGVFSSSDNGATWNPVTVTDKPYPTYSYGNMGVSIDGKVITVLISNIVYISKDYGVTWNGKVNSGVYTYGGTFALSDNGNKIFLTTSRQTFPSIVDGGILLYTNNMDANLFGAGLKIKSSASSISGINKVTKVYKWFIKNTLQNALISLSAKKQYLTTGNWSIKSDSDGRSTLTAILRA